MDKRILLSLALVILVQGSLVLALDCSKVNTANYRICQEILNSNLSLTEREALISNLEYNSSYFPDHNYIFLRNTQIRVDEAPYNIEKTNSQYIKNAWLSIFTAMPSVIYNNSLFVPKDIDILSGFNYKINLPQDYQSDSSSRTNEGDCKRTYSIISNSSINQIYVDGVYQGEGSLVDALILKNSKIEAAYSINFEVLIKHYKWNRYCCRYRDGRCTRYCYSCDYSRSENKKDQVILTDNLDVWLFQNNLTAEVIPIDSYGTNTKLKLNYSDSLELSFNNSYFYHYKYIYSLNYSKEPYYVFTLKATDYNSDKINNLYRNGNEITIKDNGGCNVRAFDFFKVLRANCNSNFLGNEIDISVDKFYYSNNQTINVNISPEDITLFLTYGNQSKNATGRTSFISDYPENKITAHYGDRSYDTIVFVYDKSKLILLWNLFLFFLLVYIFYRLARKYFRRANG